jgi:hypothetical protein
VKIVELLEEEEEFGLFVTKIQNTIKDKVNKGGI